MEFIHSYVDHLVAQGIVSDTDQSIFLNDLLYNDSIQGESFEGRAVHCLSNYIRDLDLH
jgi:hypothetical protein